MYLIWTSLLGICRWFKRSHWKRVIGHWGISHWWKFFNELFGIV